MKIRYCSDLHIEFMDRFDSVFMLNDELLPELDIDYKTILVLAGDTFCGETWQTDTAKIILESLSERFYKVLIVTGNHDYYHSSIALTHRNINAAIAGMDNVVFLNNDCIEIDGTIFFGACFWTSLSSDEWENIQIKRNMNDYNMIKVNDDEYLLPNHIKSLHNESVFRLHHVLNQNVDKRVVVISHHAPHDLSCKSNPRFYESDDVLNKAFCSDQSNLIIEHPNLHLWIHGHTHMSCDYEISQCRVVSNPYGYYDYEPNINYDEFASINC